MTGRVAVVGRGRAGGAVAGALAVAGWQVVGMFGRDSSPEDVAAGVAGADLVVVATPDAAIATVAATLPPSRERVVLHLAGSLGLDVLQAAGHARVAALHPLVSMPSAEVGARRLQAGAWFAVAGDPVAEQIVDAWQGRWFTVADEDRAAYHAAACIASNHLVALLGQVDRVAATVGVPFAAYLQLAAATLDNVAMLGPAAALTGPAARGDWGTISRHRAALVALDGLDGLDAGSPGPELAAYDAMVVLARLLVDGSGAGAGAESAGGDPAPRS